MHVRFVFLDLAGDLTHYSGVVSYGVATLAALLERDGHKVSLYHLFEDPDERTFSARVSEGGPDLIAFSLNSHYAKRLATWAAWAKAATGATVVAGGIHPSLAPDEVLALPDVDHVCVGEGEEALPGLCAALAAGGSTSGIPNLWSADDDASAREPSRVPVRDLDTLPDPKLDLFDFANLYPVRRGYFPYLMSRGCAYKCTYCSSRALRDIHDAGPGFWRFQSPRHAVDQMARLMAMHMPEPETVLFLDSILFPTRRWLREFAPLYKARIGKPFSCNLRADFVDEEVAGILADMGCKVIRFGVESGDERMNREVLDRGLGIDALRRAFALTRVHGLERISYNIIGLPEETLAMALATVKLNAEIRPDLAIPFIFTPYPGTRLHGHCRDHGLITEREYDNYFSGSVLRLPYFPVHDILFVQRFFPHLVRLYAIGRDGPAGPHRLWTRTLDAVLGGPVLPRRAVVGFYERYRRLRHVVGEYLVDRSPKLYRLLGGTDPV